MGERSIKKIAVDCRMLHMSGIGVYLENILFFWLKSEDIEWVLIGKRAELEKLSLTAKTTIVDCDIPIFSVKELLRFPVELVNSCDLFFSPNYNLPLRIKVPVYLTIHDVVFLDLKNLTTKIGYWIRYIMLTRAVKRASVVFTVSEFSKERIEYYFKCHNVVVAYNGLNRSLLAYSPLSSKPYREDDYFLFVGNMKRHKGIDVLFKALSDTNLKVKIVGPFENFKTSLEPELLSQIRISENITWTGPIEKNEELYALMVGAKALIQPSRYEGFGIPPLEAMALGTPAIVSDIPVFKEIYHKMPVLFFRDGDASHLKEILQNHALPMVDKEIIRKAYSYENTAKKMLDTLFDI